MRSTPLAIVTAIALATSAFALPQPKIVNGINSQDHPTTVGAAIRNVD